ncbi:hypothetical protein [Streptomyces mirabilis]|uniref:hypothetical protein n=1 Tax=Streptomyces mirabilis TaxID=68239 RepID=UPI00324842F4
MVALDVHFPGRRTAIVDASRQGELLGWSPLVPPHTWQLGTEARSPVHALEFAAAAVPCAEDPVLGQTVIRCGVLVVGNRLQSTRARLMDLYRPAGHCPMH